MGIGFFEPFAVRSLNYPTGAGGLFGIQKVAADAFPIPENRYPDCATHQTVLSACECQSVPFRLENCREIALSSVPKVGALG